MYVIVKNKRFWGNPLSQWRGVISLSGGTKHEYATKKHPATRFNTEKQALRVVDTLKLAHPKDTFTVMEDLDVFQMTFLEQ